MSSMNKSTSLPEVSSFVTFRVGPDRVAVRADREALINKSCVFRAMLCGPLAEKGEIIVPDSVPDVFSQFIRYMETDIVTNLEENITDVLYLAKKYSVDHLDKICLHFLCTNLSPNNAFDILQLAHTFDEKEMFNKAMEVIETAIIDGNIPEGFTDLPHDLFRRVISSSLFDSHPFVVVVSSWAEAECVRNRLDVSKENKQKVIGERFIPRMFKASFSKMPHGWIYFTCNRDILLHGFRCCALQTQTLLHVELFTPRKKKNIYLLQTDIKFPETSADGDGSVNVPLPKPMYLLKDTKYSLQVMLKNGAHTSRFGVTQAANKFTVGEYTFTVRKAPLEGLDQLIMGLIFSDCKLWRENRYRCLDDSPWWPLDNLIWAKI